MSHFWSVYITVLTLGNIFACYWLIRWTSKPRPNESKQGEITGHVWDDDLSELNNPLPRWWLWMFYLTIIFGLIYLVIYPGLGKYANTKGWTQAQQYQQEMEQAEASYGKIFKAFAAQDLKQLSKDPKALESGQRLFMTYCSQCHGSDAKGSRGFPNLTDNDWLYGGDPETIKTSILQGRNGMMPAHEAMLPNNGIEKVAEYVLSLSGRSGLDQTLVDEGKPLFMMCAGCHGMDGKGNPIIGAPNLTDDIWLYGKSRSIIQTSIRHGRQGKMPAHQKRLGNDKAHVLAAYIYSLSNK